MCVEFLGGIKKSKRDNIGIRGFGLNKVYTKMCRRVKRRLRQNSVF
jgi:hypothetical protein